jgi:ribosomal-protein-serine acetyltransferase
MFTLRVDHELELRLLAERHADELFALIDANREHLRRWLPWVDGTRSADDTRAFLKTALEAFTAGREYVCGIWYRGQLAGTMGLDVDTQSMRGEIGYWVAEPFQGRGVITRAARALTSAGFADLGLNRIAILCAIGNDRSSAVAERLGYRFEGTLREYERVGDHYKDIRVFSMLARDWDPEAS